ncbi:MAG: hypothetical protein K2I08_04680 [Muribaculaceae bacterium]|nr:hypothetical protein [Muribaculaceae bacterium]
MRNGVGGIVIPSIIAFVLVFSVSKLTKTSGDPHIYLSYFKKFKKQDEEWLKKWGKYTILLFVGGIVSAAMSLGFIFLCVAIYRNIHGPLNF